MFIEYVNVFVSMPSSYFAEAPAFFVLCFSNPNLCSFSASNVHEFLISSCLSTAVCCTSVHVNTALLACEACFGLPLLLLYAM